MRRTAAIMAGLTLVGGAAFAAAQESDTASEYETQSPTTNPYGEEETEEHQASEPETEIVPEAETTTGAEAGQQTGHDVSQMSAEELGGMTITTADGEEVGTIEEVGYSSMHQEKVVTVNVGGFLGVGEKLIAIPLSRVETGSDDSLRTSMDRREIEAAQEFDPSNLTAEEQQQRNW